MPLRAQLREWLWIALILVVGACGLVVAAIVLFGLLLTVPTLAADCWKIARSTEQELERGLSRSDIRWCRDYAKRQGHCYTAVPDGTAGALPLWTIRMFSPLRCVGGKEAQARKATEKPKSSAPARKAERKAERRVKEARKEVAPPRPAAAPARESPPAPLPTPAPPEPVGTVVPDPLSMQPPPAAAPPAPSPVPASGQREGFLAWLRSVLGW